VGSSKKPKPSKQPKKLPKQPKPQPAVAAIAERAERTPVAADAVDPASLADLHARVQHLAGRLSVLEHQLERVLLLQQRSNTLLELLAGSAFDIEIGHPPR
jgi:hypothetical protein